MQSSSRTNYLERLPDASIAAVVETISFSTHALAHAERGEHFAHHLRGVLTAAVGVEEEAGHSGECETPPMVSGH